MGGGIGEIKDRWGVCLHEMCPTALELLLHTHYISFTRKKCEKRQMAIWLAEEEMGL